MTSFTETTTFTRSHAEYLATKVATDLKRIQRLYGAPSDSWILKYETELIEILAAGYLGKLVYGFRRHGYWIVPTLRYTSQDIFRGSVVNDDPGKIRAGADISEASFHSHLIYNSTWNSLNAEQKTEFGKRLPFQRTSGQEPGTNGYFDADRTYSAGGRALDRATLRSS